jgi:AcrR family transcriptional regulator
MSTVSITKGLHTRQVIIEAAYSLFLEQGYAATSMRQIAGRAGRALGGIYNHFESKEAIFAELIIERHPFQQILPIMLNTPANDIEQFIRKAARTMVHELGKRPDFIKLMFIEIVEFNGKNMPLILEQVLPKALPLVKEFDKNKKILRPIPTFIFLRAFIGLFFSYYMTELLLADIPAARVQGNTLDHFVDIFLHGVLVNKELT